MPTVLKLLAGGIFAFILLGFFIGLNSQMEETTRRKDFKEKVEKIKKLTKSLKTQSTGARIPIKLTIPENSELRFENNFIIFITNKTKRFDTGIKIRGKTLNSGIYDLKLVKKEDKVKVNVK